jgi:hypothetical protein
MRSDGPSRPVGDDWKRHHANDSTEAVQHEIVQRVMEEYADNMGFTLDGLPAYGLRKVALYAAQVARAQALGFDPNLLRLSEDEAASGQWALAASLVLAGVPTFTIDPPTKGSQT